MGKQPQTLPPPQQPGVQKGGARVGTRGFDSPTIEGTAGVLWNKITGSSVLFSLNIFSSSKQRTLSQRFSSMEDTASSKAQPDKEIFFGITEFFDDSHDKGFDGQLKTR